MCSEAISVSSLAIQSAKVVKQNIIVVLTYLAYVFQSAVVIRLTILCVQVDVIISERKGYKKIIHCLSYCYYHISLAF